MWLKPHSKPGVQGQSLPTACLCASDHAAAGLTVPTGFGWTQLLSGQSRHVYKTPDLAHRLPGLCLRFFMVLEPHTGREPWGPGWGESRLFDVALTPCP